jgi:hypothetical protein
MTCFCRTAREVSTRRSFVVPSLATSRCDTPVLSPLSSFQLPLPRSVH